MFDEWFDIDEISYPAVGLAIMGAAGVWYYLAAIAKAGFFQIFSVAALTLLIGYFVAARILDA